jgi:hypothetical protein
MARLPSQRKQPGSEDALIASARVVHAYALEQAMHILQHGSESQRLTLIRTLVPPLLRIAKDSGGSQDESAAERALIEQMLTEIRSTKRTERGDEAGDARAEVDDPHEDGHLEART